MEVLPRLLTDAESKLVLGLLARAGMDETNAARDVFKLRVVEQCQCGCSSVDFVSTEAPNERGGILADYYATVPEGFAVGVILWGTRDQVNALEVYSLANDPPYGTPLVTTLTDVPPQFESAV